MTQFDHHKLLKGIHAFTDGGCDPNPGIGGWAFVLLLNGEIFECFGSDGSSTNNRMEFTAALQAIKASPVDQPLTIYTDSQLLVQTASQWMKGWKSNNWKKKSKGEIANLDLVKELDRLTEGRIITWQWVKGHSGVKYNERCDELCTQAIKIHKASKSV